MKEITVFTADGYPLEAHIIEPAQSNGKVLLVNSATGVKQQVYFSFGKYLAEKGFTVITYDYRGIGLSKPEKLKGFRASMRIWGTHDFKALSDYVKEHYPEYEKFCLGHSVGALILGMSQGSSIFSRFIFVGTQDAYIGHLPKRIVLTALLGFGVAVPFTSNVLGYFPAHWFGLGESLPKGTAMDWRTLVLNRKSTSKLYEKLDVQYSKNLYQKTLVIFAEDDPWVKMKGMESLMNTAYPNLQKTYREVKTEESPKNHIGHINFFRRYNSRLWKIIVDELS